MTTVACFLLSRILSMRDASMQTCSSTSVVSIVNDADTQTAQKRLPFKANAALRKWPRQERCRNGGDHVLTIASRSRYYHLRHRRLTSERNPKCVTTVEPQQDSRTLLMSNLHSERARKRGAAGKPNWPTKANNGWERRPNLKSTTAHTPPHTNGHVRKYARQAMAARTHARILMHNRSCVVQNPNERHNSCVCVYTAVWCVRLPTAPPGASSQPCRAQGGPRQVCLARLPNPAKPNCVRRARLAHFPNPVEPKCASPGIPGVPSQPCRNQVRPPSTPGAPSRPCPTQLAAPRMPGALAHSCRTNYHSG